MEYLCKHINNISKVYSILSSMDVKIPYIERWEQDVGDVLDPAE